MLDKETYNKEIVRMWDSLRDDNYKGRKDCYGVECRECPLCSICNVNAKAEDKYKAFEFIEAVEKWSKEHPKPKYRISKMEYEILYSLIDSIMFASWSFGNDIITYHLLKKGYFKGASKEMKIKEYFDNCEIKGEVKNGNQL